MIKRISILTLITAAAIGLLTVFFVNPKKVKKTREEKKDKNLFI